MKDDRQTLYKCPECDLHYEGEEIAKKCEAWRKEHKSCNLELIKYATESKQTEN